MKVDDFHNHVNQDSEFFRILRYLPRPQKDGPWLAGGSVWKAIENQPVEHDLDFFFYNKDQREQWIRTLNSIPYVHHIVGEKSNKYNTTYSFHINEKGYNKTVAIQAISFRYWSGVEELIDGFDFTACQFGFDGRKLFSGDTAFDDLRTRTIRFNKIHDPRATIIHLNKYITKGFKIPPDQQQKFDDIKLKSKNEKKLVDIVIESNGERSIGGITLVSEADEYPTTLPTVVVPSINITMDITNEVVLPTAFEMNFNNTQSDPPF